MFDLVIEIKTHEFLKKLPRKTRHIVVEEIPELKEDPFSGGNKDGLECIHVPVVYCLHVSRFFT